MLRKLKALSVADRGKPCVAMVHVPFLPRTMLSKRRKPESTLAVRQFCGPSIEAAAAHHAAGILPIRRKTGHRSPVRIRGRRSPDGGFGSGPFP